MKNNLQRKRNFWSKKRQRILCAVSVAALLFAAVLWSCPGEEKSCACNSFRYHAPCLLDLETGQLIELDLYVPHATKVAELTDPQPEQSTFSYIRLGDASGHKNTALKQIEVTIPIAEKTYHPALCNLCRKKLDTFPAGRYMLADLYSEQNQELIPIVEGIDLTIRCYTVSVSKLQSGVLKLVLQGTLQ